MKVMTMVVPGTMLAMAAALLPATGSAAIVGDTACTSGQPAVLVNVVGLKDRKGELKLELYPPNDEDFLRDDRDLVKEGKMFRRVRLPTPQSGPVEVCIRVPGPGRYALLATHNRDGKNKFSFWSDGAGFISNEKLGRSRPKLAEALLEVGPGPRSITIRMQYLRGLGGFSPIN